MSIRIVIFRFSETENSQKKHFRNWNSATSILLSISAPRGQITAIVIRNRFRVCPCTFVFSLCVANTFLCSILIGSLLFRLSIAASSNYHRISALYPHHLRTSKSISYLTFFEQSPPARVYIFNLHSPQITTNQTNSRRSSFEESIPLLSWCVSSISSMLMRLNCMMFRDTSVNNTNDVQKSGEHLGLVFVYTIH